MEFKRKTPAEFDALSEYQKEKYLDEKSAHEQKVAEDAAKAAAEKAVNDMRDQIKADNQAIIDALKADNEKAIADLTEAQKLKLEEVEAAMKRAKIGEAKIRMKGFSDHVVDALSTKEGEQMVKDFLAGQRSKLNVTIGGDDDPDFTVKAMGVPANGVAPEFTPIVGPGHDEFHARTIIPVFPTISNLIRYIQYTVDTTAGLGFQTVGVGAQKPSLNYIPAVKDAPVQKIAGLLDVPDELLDDVVGFRAWIAYELPKAYMDAEDLQIFKGDGTGLNLLGLWTQAGNQTFPQGSVTAASNTIDKIVAGITQVRKLKRNTSAVVISAVAWQEILINKGTTKDYTYPIVLDANGVMRIGGVPIFWSNVFADGEGLVGDFARGTAIFQRKSMQIGYFDQNKDNVEKNIVTIRLEGRIALPIFYPESFKKLLLVVTT
jgi:HK97 family phage major capsid protein